MSQQPARASCWPEDYGTRPGGAGQTGGWGIYSDLRLRSTGSYPLTTADDLDRSVRTALCALPPGPSRAGPDALLHPGSSLTGRTALQIYEAQLESRHLDLASGWMQQPARGSYTICSSLPAATPLSHP